MDRLLKYCTTADAVYSEERILDLIGVLSFGVGKFNIALTLGYYGFGAYLLTFHRRCQLTAQHQNESVCLGRAIFAVRSKQHKALENQKLIITAIISIFVTSPICSTLFRFLWSCVLRCVW